MGLKKDFYIQIFEEEQKWIELINSKLLNSVYCKYTLQPFYLNKRAELEQEYNLTKNEIIKNIINIIDSLLEQISVIHENFSLGHSIDIKTLLPLFLTTQMNSALQTEEKIDKNDQDIYRLNIKKQLLENEIRYFEQKEIDDYVYDEFPEEIKKIK